MSTQREIARLAKTSLKTVSRVINNDPLVNAKTRDRIRKVIEEVGYTPNQAARMMRSQKSNIIGFLADHVATTSSSIELVRGAQDVARERGKQMMMFNIERGQDSESLAESQLAEYRAEAIVYATVFHQEVRVAPNDTPHVLLNCFEAEDRFPSVLPDDYRLGHDLMLEILRRGYRRPLFLNLGKTVEGGRLRAEGFRKAAGDAGLDVTDAIRTAAAEPDRPHEYFVGQILRQEFARDERPDILVCGQDLMAIPVYFELGAMGLTIGRDIAVTSFDNLQPISRLLEPGLSTMELPYYEMGRAAMAIAIDGPDGPARRLVSGRFVERASM